MRSLHLPLWLSHEWERSLARSLSLSWALFWIWFGFASGAAEYASLSEIVLQTLPGLLFLLTSLVAVREPAVGGTLLISMGVIIFAMFWGAAGAQDLPSILAIESLLAFPPVFCGGLYLSSASQPR